jgi:hypothetical protein
MAAVARAERAWVDAHPDHEPYFHDLLKPSLRHALGNGRIGRWFLRWTPRSTPVLGEWVWKRADFYFSRRLAEPFMEGWSPEPVGDRRR